jgi:hypothetical protein
VRRRGHKSLASGKNEVILASAVFVFIFSLMNALKKIHTNSHKFSKKWKIMGLPIFFR